MLYEQIKKETEAGMKKAVESFEKEYLQLRQVGQQRLYLMVSLSHIMEQKHQLTKQLQSQSLKLDFLL